MSEESRKHNSHAAESWRELAGDVRQWADGHRLAITATVALVVLNLVVWLVVAMAGFAFPLRLDTSMAEFDFGKLFCTLFLARGVIQLILDAALWLVMLSIAEPWLGRARTVGTALACALGGVIVGLILCAAAGWLFQDSQFVSRMQFALSPLVLPVGALMAASAFCSHLLRRRIRLIGYVAILVALLYSGNPGDYCILAAALIGHAVGRVMAGSPAHAETGWHWLRSTSFEARRMFAAIAVVLALGPVIAITSHNHAGPLSTVGLLMSPVSVDDGTLARCLAGATHSGCFLQFDLMRASMPGAVLRSLLPTAVTLVLAWGLYRGRRFAATCAVAINLFTAGVAIAYYLVVPLSFAPDGMTSLLQHGAITACVTNTLPPLIFAIALAAAMKHFPIRVGWRRLIGGVGAIVLVLLACAAVYLMYGIAQPDAFSPRALAELEHELRGLPEPHAPAPFDGEHAQGGGQVGLSASRLAVEHEVLRLGREIEAGRLLLGVSVGQAHVREVVAVEAFGHREPGLAHEPCPFGGLPVGQFRGEHAVYRGELAGRGPFERFVDGGLRDEQAPRPLAQRAGVGPSVLLVHSSSLV